MFVFKRDGRKESIMFDKITSRIRKLCYGLNMDFIDPPAITMKVLLIFYWKFIQFKKKFIFFIFVISKYFDFLVHLHPLTGDQWPLFRYYHCSIG